MKNKEQWQPTKYEYDGNKLRPSKHHKHVAVGSRLTADVLARIYQEAIYKYARGLLVDLGCGQAPLYGYYKKFVSDTICIDWEQKGHKNPYLDYVSDLNLRFPLPDNYCDTLLVTDVLEHISNPDLFWQELARITKEEGVLILGSPFLYPIHEQPFDYARYSEYKLRFFCKMNGFTVLELKPYGGTPEVLLNLIANHLNFCKCLAAIHVFLSRLLLKNPLCKYLSTKTEHKFPLGYILVAKKHK